MGDPTKASVRDAELEGRRVLLRADLNVPLDSASGEVTVADDTRITASLPTIELLRDAGASIVLVSHLGRPEGVDPALSMGPVARRLSELLGAEVRLAPAVVGPEVEAMAAGLEPGDVLMLENSRFEAGETEDDPELVIADITGSPPPEAVDFDSSTASVVVSAPVSDETLLATLNFGKYTARPRL